MPPLIFVQEENQPIKLQLKELQVLIFLLSFKSPLNIVFFINIDIIA